MTQSRPSGHPLITRHVVGMSDGAGVAVDVYASESTAIGPAAVIQVGEARATVFVLRLTQALRRKGFTVAVQRFTDLSVEDADGRAEGRIAGTVRWVREQPWSDGAVVVIGVATPGLRALATSAGDRHGAPTSVISIMSPISVPSAFVDGVRVPTLCLSGTGDGSARATLATFDRIGTGDAGRACWLVMTAGSRDRLFKPQTHVEARDCDAIQSLIGAFVARTVGGDSDDSAPVARVWWQLESGQTWIALRQYPAATAVACPSGPAEGSDNGSSTASGDERIPLSATTPFDEERLVVGAPEVAVGVDHEIAGEIAVRILEVDARGAVVTVRDGVAAFRTVADGTRLLQLPAIAWRVAAGHRVRVEVARTGGSCTAVSRLVLPIVPASAVHPVATDGMPQLAIAAAPPAMSRASSLVRAWRAIVGRISRFSDSVTERQFAVPSGLLGIAVGAVLKWSNRELNDWTRQLLDARPSDHVLEIGFGPGDSIAALARSSRHVTGIDVSDVMVRKAARRNVAACADGRVRLVRGSATALPFGSEMFDRVIGVNSVQVWRNRASALADVRRVLEPAGIVALSRQPKFNTPLATVEQIGHELAREVAGAGFSDVSVRFASLKAGHAVCVLAVKPIATAVPLR